MLGFSTNDDISKLSDEELLRRSRSEPWLFAVLLDRYQEPFLRKVRGILYSEEDAEEVVQDTFTKIYLNAGRFAPQEGASFSSWAYRVLLNTAFTRYQKLVKEGQRFTRVDPEFEKFMGDNGLHTGMELERDLVERVLHKMPGHLSAVLRLHYLERWSQQDIAELNKEDVGAVKARVHRAKAVFRKLINAQSDA
ncbi:RNA polymerase sigma factor [Candidatus Nomurabacteria bacterium]|nr:RNA polymerase sigma factor [Candidatus Nomurabacteria bacterium]